LSKNKETQANERVEEYVAELRKDMDKRLDELKNEMNVLTRRATKTVVERPLLALAVAFVAGMALGIALSKSSD
jgi:ElaB/YqjD/DUF883 family membrane-anchored ribosome-binding protein